MRKKIALLHRKWEARRFSIENTFKPIESLAYIHRIELPTDLITLRDLPILLRFSSKIQEKYIHITGHVHYMAIFLFWKRIIITIHDTYHYEGMRGLKKFVFGMFWFKIPIWVSKKVVSVSPNTRERLITELKIKPDKIITIPNPITINNSVEKLSKYSIFTVLIIGTKENKNLLNLVSAVHGINDLQLIIVGILTIEQKNVLDSNDIKYINKMNLSEDELLREYKKCHVLFMASLREGFGLPILEAQLLGLPVLTSNFEPMTYVAGEGAVFVDPFNIEEIKSVILQFKELKINIISLIESGHSNVQRFSQHSYSIAYQNLYKEVFGI